MSAWYGKSDVHALTAIASGDLVANRETGHVDYCGNPVGVGMKSGYIGVSIRRMVGRGWITVPAHRIVWMFCHAPIPAGMVINHRNGRRWDNRLANLELVTHGDNGRHAKRLPYAAVADIEDDNCVSTDWFNKVSALANSGDVSKDEIAALMPTTDRSPVIYTDGARQWRHPVGRRGEHCRA